MNKIMNTLSKIILGIFLIGAVTSCDELELPEAGSIPDQTPPSADFGYEADPGNYQSVAFANFSISATDYLWDFGNGNTSNEKNPTVTYADGSYLVTLTASDKLGKSSTVSDSVHIEKPQSTFKPVILNPGYDEEGDDSYRNFWRNSDLGGPLQITGSPVHDGVKSGKLPSGGDRVAYQAFTVEPDVDYVLTFYYTMKSDPGTFTVKVLDGEVTNPADIDGAQIAIANLTDQTDANVYVRHQLEFTSKSSTAAILVQNLGVECRFDTWTIEVK